MQVMDIIARKRDGGELTEEEIRFFIQGVVAGTIPDYQASAWLMAVYLRGMTRRETLDLTLAMRDSGERLDLSDLLNGPALDKHSTGGVGDKTTLVMVPILAAAGIPMLKMSGRGLGHSGGTVDKLESIPGFRTNLSVAEAKAQVRRVGAALLAQTGDLAPADRILYALRDVTATVACIPLIVSSILSKKLAAGAQRIVLDVKVGSGAFMKTRERAEELAQELVAIGTAAGVPTTALLTAMEEPLGFAVGNALEVAEALAVLSNTSPIEADFRDLCLDLAAHALVIVGRAESTTGARALAEDLLTTGKAASKFGEIVGAQGGPDTCEAILAALPVAPTQHAVKAEFGGVVAAIDAEAVGKLAMRLGAGRATISDAIDPAVGIVLTRKTGDSAAKSDTLATLHLRAQDAERAEEFADAFRAAVRIVPPILAPSLPSSLVLDTISSTER
ncbi:MAG TPA: thymidine phosphorylase [Chthonomonadaceae bacterium]|nr:thymidine phosphorylase [Chthonomonadaceae bacterium]